MDVRTVDSMDAVGQRTKEALTALVENSLAAQRRAPVRDLRAHCTITLAGPRSSGQTTAMVDVANRTFKRPVFVFANEQMARHCAKHMEIPDERWATFRNAGRTLKGRRADCVAVDCATHMTESQRDDVLHVCEAFMAAEESFCLLLIG